MKKNISLKEVFKDEWLYFKSVLFRFGEDDLNKLFPYWLLVVFSSCKKLKVYVNHEEQMSNLLIHFLASQNTGKSYTVNSALSIVPENFSIPIGSGESFKTIALRGKSKGYIVFDEVQKSFVKYLTMPKETLTSQIINIWNNGTIDNYATKQDETKVIKESEAVKDTLSKSKFDMACSCFFIGIEKTYIEKIPKELYSDGFFARNIFVRIPLFDKQTFFETIPKEKIEEIKQLRDTLRDKYAEGTEEFIEDHIQIDDEKTQKDLERLSAVFFEENKSENFAVNVNLDRAIKANAIRCAGLFYQYSKKQKEETKEKEESFIEWFNFSLNHIIKPSIEYFSVVVEGDDDLSKIKNYFSSREKVEISRLKDRCERALGDKITKERWLELKNELFGLNKYGYQDKLQEPILEIEDNKFVKLYGGKKSTYIFPSTYKHDKTKDVLEDNAVLDDIAKELFN